MAEARSRSLVRPGPTGVMTRYKQNGQVESIDTSEWNITTQSMKDIIGNEGGENGLISEKVTKKYYPVNGRNYFEPGHTLAVDVAGFMDYVQTYGVYYHEPLSLKSIDGVTAAARTNPNKPLMDLPVFLAELRDLPGMLKDASKWRVSLQETARLVQRAGEGIINRNSGRGRGVIGSAIGLSKSAGSANLQYQFGWKPLVSDLAKLLGLMEAYNRRLKELTKLMTTGRLTRRITIDEASTVGIYPEGWHSYAFNLGGRIVITTQARRWAVTHWKSTGDYPPNSEPSQVDVWRTLLGLDITPGQLWAVLPWSWLVDYFGNIGDYLDAHRNTIPVSFDGGSIMTKTTTTAQRFITYSSDWISGGSGSYVRETKERSPITLSPLPSGLPFLGAHQVGILGSLSVTRRNAWK